MSLSAELVQGSGPGVKGPTQVSGFALDSQWRVYKIGDAGGYHEGFSYRPGAEKRYFRFGQACLGNTVILAQMTLKGYTASRFRQLHIYNFQRKKLLKSLTRHHRICTILLVFLF